jgi:DNA-binding transcriptional MerR regulator
MRDAPDAPKEIVFDDGKAPDALRTIGEVSRALGIQQHVLRYWEQQFPTLQPAKRSGGRRYYRAQDIALLARIAGMVYREGYTLRGARQALASKRPEDKPAGEPSVDLGTGLARIRARLAEALAAA